MLSVNKVILIGNLTRDPELKQTSGGQSITTFGVATNRKWTTSNGDQRSSAEFHEIVVWAKLAEICNQYLKKGMLVYIEGYLKTRSWDMEDGTRRYKTEIVANEMIMLDKNKSDEFGDYSSSSEDHDMDDMPADDEAMPVVEAAAPAVEAPASEDSSKLEASIDDDDLF